MSMKENKRKLRNPTLIKKSRKQITGNNMVKERYYLQEQLIGKLL